MSTLPGFPPLPSAYQCKCTCTSAGLAFIPLDGAFFTRTYKLFPFCTNIFGFSFHNGGLGNVWTLISGYDENGEPIPGEVEFQCDDELEPRILHGTMTVNTAARGGVVIEIFDQFDVLFARWVSKTAFQPRCYLRMKLVEFDRTCAGNQFDPRPCLWVYVDRESCLCDNDHWAYRVTASIPNPYTYDGLLAQYLAYYEGIYSVAAITAWVDCLWGGLEYHYGLVNAISIVCEATETPGVACDWAGCVRLYSGTGAYLCDGLEDAPAYEENVVHARVYVTSGPALAVMVNVNAAGACGGSFGTSYSITVPIASGDAGKFCLEGTISDSAAGGTITATPIRIPTTLSGYVDPTCILGNYNICSGGSLWEATREETRPGKVAWDWTLITSTCEGWCQSLAPLSCVPTIPDDPVLPEGEINEEDEAGYGLTGLDGEQFVGGCACTARYYPPVIPCTGSSWWTLNRTACPDYGAGYHVYWWGMDSSTCAGTCNCDPVPPYALPTTPVTEAQAVTAGVVLADLGVSQESTCECDPEVYVPAECPVCTCDDVTANKTFTISGLTDEHEILNGLYTLTKGAGGCGVGDCCWYGLNEGANGEGTLVWSAGLWTLTVAGGGGVGATYTLSASDPCGSPLVLTKVSGDAEMPATITVSG